MSSARFALFCICLPSLAFAETVFTDGTFSLSNYANPFVITSGDISGAYSQCASCGNPGQALSTTFSASGTSDMYIGLLNTGFVYTPSTQGAIASIDASVDNSTSPIFNISSYNLFLPLIEQDGNYFATELQAGPGNSGFVNISADLLASDFDQIDPTTGVTTATSHPNFAGDTMEFGLIVSDGSIALPPFTQTVIYDNLAIDLVPAPEPASLLIMSAALAGLAILRHRT